MASIVSKITKQQFFVYNKYNTEREARRIQLQALKIKLDQMLVFVKNTCVHVYIPRFKVVLRFWIKIYFKIINNLDLIDNIARNLEM